MTEPKYTVVIGDKETETRYACFFTADSEADAKEQMIEKGFHEDHKITMVFPPKEKK